MPPSSGSAAADPVDIASASIACRSAARCAAAVSFHAANASRDAACAACTNGSTYAAATAQDCCACSYSFGSSGACSPRTRGWPQSGRRHGPCLFPKIQGRNYCRPQACWRTPAGAQKSIATPSGSHRPRPTFPLTSRASRRSRARSRAGSRASPGRRGPSRRPQASPRPRCARGSPAAASARRCPGAGG